MRVMFLILKFLYRQDAKNEIVALTLKDIVGELAEQGYKYSDRTIYNKLRTLLSEGYVNNGLKDVNAATFYITMAGIEWMKEKEKDVDEEENSNAEK